MTNDIEEILSRLNDHYVEIIEVKGKPEIVVRLIDEFRVCVGCPQLERAYGLIQE